MGGRGSNSGLRSDGGVISSNATERTIQGRYIEGGIRGGYYRSDILEATPGESKGELTFNYATPVSREKTAKTNKTQYLTYKLKAGAENGDVFGVNWNNVNRVSGQTYSLRSTLKKQGFKWNGSQKVWER